MLTNGLSKATYRSLDAWRGVACLSVIIYHTTGPAGTIPASRSLAWIYEITGRLGFGVTLFFVISGYCIAASADKTQRLGQPWHQYFVRRLRRIFPPLWAFFLLSAIAALSLERMSLAGPLLRHAHGGFTTIVSPMTLKPWQWLGNITLTEGWRGSILWRGGAGWWHGHTWSLGYEEQFYLVVGMLLLTTGQRWLRAAGALTACIAMAYIFLPLGPVAGFFVDGSWLFFAYGLALYFHRTEATGSGLLLIPAAVVLGIGLGLRDGNDHLIVAAMFCLLLTVLGAWDGPIATHRLTRPLSWCGTRCYSIYLLHWPITKIVCGIGLAFGLFTPVKTLAILVPTSLALSLLAAIPFHHFVERRFLNAPQPSRRIPSSPDVVLAMSPMAGVDRLPG